MCANNLTYAAVTGIRSDRARDATARYRRFMQYAVRLTLYGDDKGAQSAAEHARRIAHHESRRGNFAPLIDQLERALGID